MTTSDLYRLHVHVETREETGETLDEWDAQQHRGIQIRTALTPETMTKYSRSELFAAFRWCSGIIARAAIHLHERVIYEDPARRAGTHDCPDHRCGLLYGDVESPRSAAIDGTYGPGLWIEVPAGNAQRWAKVFRSTLAEMIADDLCPVTEETKPSHGNAVLAEPVSQPRKAHA